MNSLKTQFAYDPEDSDEIRLEKISIFLVATACCVAGLLWSAMYYVVFGWGITTALPALFTLIVGGGLFASHISKNHHYAIYAQIVCIIYVTTFIQWSIGSVFDSGVVLVWAFLGPICALMFFSIRQSIIWFALYLINILISVIFNDYFVSNGQDVASTTQLFFLLMNLGIASSVVFVFASYYVNSAIKEHNEVNKLLNANLQQEIALRQNEKLATLGKLSAGVAHELNNPAAAAQRGSAQLQDAITKLRHATFQMMQFDLTMEQVETILGHEQKVRESVKSPISLDPLARSDKEYEIETWLEDRGVEDAWELAPMLVSIGYECQDLAQLAEKVTKQSFPIILTVLSQAYEVQNTMGEIGQGAGRIIEIVKALKSYTYLDQAPTQCIDVHEGLNDTLIMLRSKLKEGIELQRDFAPDLPKIDAFGNELNQVWTNIIDNAITAMEGKGKLALRTFQQNSWIVVQIQDNGPGIPQEIQGKIFDPFFTTKAPGEGTGLGLNISYNIIVQKHKGEFTVYSKPGETCFEVKLPCSQKE